jgi:hypothetical protein
MRYFTSEYFDGNGGHHDRPLSDPDPKKVEAYKAAHPDAKFSPSYLMMRILQLRLNKALSNLSGLQQRNDMRTYGEARQAHGEERANEIMAENRLHDERSEAENEDIARDIAMAITGMEITFVPVPDPRPEPKYGNLAMIGRTKENENDPGSWRDHDEIMKVLNELERMYGRR